MTRSQYGPAAGTSKGPAPLPAAIHLPEYLNFSRAELELCFHILRDPLAWSVYGLLRTQADFTSGHTLQTYARLMELLTPPQPERGRRRRGPSYDQLRRVVEDLERLGLVKRNASNNAAQGQLRLWLPHVAGAAHERENRRKAQRAQPIKAQDLAQGSKARKAA